MARVWSLAGCLALVLSGLAAPPAAASVIRCWGSMRHADCLPATGSWSASSQPTFGAACEGCGHLGGDAGSGCFPLSAGPRGFSLEVDGQLYSGERYFEEVRDCAGGEHLLRYKGPLVPAKLHEIVYPGNVDYSQPKRYRVAFFVDAVPDPPPALADAGSPADAARSPDAGAAADLSPATANDGGAPDPAARRASGCSHGSGAAGGPASLAVALVLLVCGRRRRAALVGVVGDERARNAR